MKKNNNLNSSATVRILIKLVCFLLIVAPTVFSAVHAAETGDTATFNEILKPVLKITNFVKYAATILALLYLIFAGVNFVISGGNAANRENSKSMIAFIIIGLAVIWAAPLIINYVFA